MNETEKIEKNIVMAIRSDASGTGFIRTQYWMDYLTAVFGPTGVRNPIITPMSIFDQNILARTKTINFQRSMNAHGQKLVEMYKRLQQKFNFKLTSDIDDFIFKNPEGGESLPDYNFCQSNIITPEFHDSAITIYNMCDEVTVSTKYLKDYLIDNGVTTKITILPNTVNQFFYGKPKRKITSPIIKPKVIYCGSPTHYHNEKKLPGDFGSGDWIKWVIDSVNKNKIDFVIMGGLPFFFEEIKDKIRVIDWVNPMQYHLVLMSVKPDISIMPLVSNIFNYAKSNIKYLEACAINAVGIGTIFERGPSPYDDNIVTVPENVSFENIERIVEELKNPLVFNGILERQRSYLDSNGLWLESKQNIDRLISVY